jgi:hypothetical protein
MLARSKQKNQPKVTLCHRKGKSPVAISWYNVLGLTLYQEIATPLRGSQ